MQQIELAITSLLANQPVASESERGHDQCQSAAVTHGCRVSRHLIHFIAIDRALTISIVVSAIAVFRLVDNLMPSRLQIVHRPNYKLKPLEL